MRFPLGFPGSLLIGSDVHVGRAAGSGRWVRPSHATGLRATLRVRASLRRQRPHRCPISASQSRLRVSRCAGGVRLRSCLAGHRGVRPALRRVGVLRGEDDGDLLQAQLSGPHAQTRERSLLRVRSGGAVRRLSRLQALPPGCRAGFARVGSSRRSDRAGDAADRRRRRGPRGGGRARPAPRLHRAPRAPPARRGGGRGPARSRARPTRADRAHPARDDDAAGHRCGVRRRLSERAAVQRHGPGCVRHDAQRSARARAQIRTPRGQWGAVAATALPGADGRRRHRQVPGAASRSGYRAGAGRRLPPKPAPAARRGRGRAASGRGVCARDAIGSPIYAISARPCSARVRCSTSIQTRRACARCSAQTRCSERSCAMRRDGAWPAPSTATSWPSAPCSASRSPCEAPVRSRAGWLPITASSSSARSAR